MKIIIFTDLDGTLLNHDDYSYQEAQSALELLKREKIPLILVTSKTRQEVELLQSELNIKEPFIVENGGGIFFPLNYRNYKLESGIEKNNHYLIQLGKTYEEIRKFFLDVKEDFKIKGFGDMDVDEIIRLTNLPANQAEFAKKREFTEPFIIEKTDKIDKLKVLALEKGIIITKGGRFYHFIGINQDKGKAVKIINNIFRNNMDGDIKTVALGDSKNDIPMLREVDIPVLIPKPSGIYEALTLPHLIKAHSPGSEGWNEIVLSICDRVTKVTNKCNDSGG